MTAAEWPARRTARGTVLCGRKAEDLGGQHACLGAIGAVEAGRFYFLPGIDEESGRPGWWRPSARSAKRIAEGRMPRWHRTVRTSDTGERALVWKEPTLPARYSCPSAIAQRSSTALC
jgi:hypothetical protein